jgi:Ca2+-binding EF-hand superfamily protein
MSQAQQHTEDDLIDKEEFKKLMTDTFQPLNIPVTQDMVDWNFSQIDTDNSGRITFKEYTEFLNKYNSPSSAT